MTDNYMLSRESDESSRLDYQHKVYIDNFEYYLHPVITKSLPPDAAIADIATGTAVFLRGLAPTLPHTVQYHGFDISAAQFPPAGSLPPNVELHVHNATLPFPDEFRGRFDAVHLRLLVAALATHEDWITVARNAIQLLKPGGYIQWCESSFSDLASFPFGLRREAVPADDSGAQVGVRSGKLVKPVIEGMMPFLQRGWKTLPGIFADLGCDVTQDVVSSDRVGEQSRQRSTLLAIGPMQNMYSNLCRTGVLADSPELQQEKLRLLSECITADEKAGTYYRWNMYNIIGRAPGSGPIGGR